MTIAQPTSARSVRGGMFRGLGEYLRPQEPIPRQTYLAILIASTGVLIGLWCIVTYAGLVEPLFLPSPSAIIRSGAEMTADGSLLQNAGASLYVIVTGWALAVVGGVPVGILMGSFKAVEALIEPVIDFVRYLPVSALIPLLILYIGIGTSEKIAVIFIGTFFQLVLLVADVAAHSDKTLQVWDAVTGKKYFIHRNPSSTITSVAWSYDGRYLATGANDKLVQVWDTITRNSVATYAGHTGYITSVSWAPDGKQLVSASVDHTIHVWHI